MKESLLKIAYPYCWFIVICTLVLIISIGALFNMA